MMKTYEEKMKEMTFEEFEAFEEEITEALDTEGFDEDKKTREVAEKYGIDYETINWYDFYGEDE